jgi:hypothetical protein
MSSSAEGAIHSEFGRRISKGEWESQWDIQLSLQVLEMTTQHF